MGLLLLLCTLLLAVPAPALGQDARAVTASRLAWRALEAGRLDEAADRFRDALFREPRDPVLHIGAGLVAHLLNRPAEARASLEEALRLDPRLTDASLLLGHIAYRRGDLGSAVRVYEDALVHAPGHELLTEKLSRWRAEAEVHDRLDSRLSNNFTLLFKGATDQVLAERALEVLEAAYWRIGSELTIYPATPITVVLYTEQQFADITRSPRWAAAAFDGAIRVPVRGALEQQDELERLLNHEVTHALVWSVAPTGVPFWLGEGLAVLFERGEPEATGADQSEAGPQADDQDRTATRPEASSRPGRRAPPPARLAELHGPFAGFSDDRAEAAYAQGARATERLLGLIGPIGVSSLLSDIGAGIPFETAFAARAPLTYAEFQEWLAQLN
jgi:tetratricopeptide (TPR) repeat protein